MTASIPEFLAFKDDTEKKLFLAQGAFITAVHEMTDFPEDTSFAERVLERTRAA
jgi:hypothetical protein